ncbi:thermonuclease family protein [Verminephrobacter aporrectodeae]|uniref:Thermonuclease family protein n=2 Tax=Verminephrobacter TaxID=364316 RepID=A0ABT3KS67_9BURK|nr:thermonuclease family protein [Verminephrobacter aporrectodeae]MCW5220422.1 thermonuclease family protein [Verminephrobacter aporrectodeae subsp. tuberculatae]MCW5255623.1 thermonuclease family protein [Verminephrobacter aporrectodeae subsp. tuberculatae]MCW5289718.1 thermonuclease family protein [Verminephrobacter aporrectodeae subsp. tuberculatae]MCW5320645.1 thermonuclease family protein [Verminephrobacter aporrectodeae subsp. tuberculatae]MCW8165976.1 thermonuclease family protein [Verm
MPLASLLCLVIAVNDGDTLTVRCAAPDDRQPVRVRIAAIDAPEWQQAFGQQARQHLAQICFRQQATLRPVDQDSYGRTVADVRCGDTDAASAQVRAGLAWVYRPYARAHPHLPPLERQAQEQGLGLWSQKQPQAPWNYRHHR